MDVLPRPTAAAGRAARPAAAMETAAAGGAANLAASYAAVQSNLRKQYYGDLVDLRGALLNTMNQAPQRAANLHLKMQLIDSALQMLEVGAAAEALTLRCLCPAGTAQRQKLLLRLLLHELHQWPCRRRQAAQPPSPNCLAIQRGPPAPLPALPACLPACRRPSPA